jgi:flagellar hook assembly protein FlgD
VTDESASDQVVPTACVLSQNYPNPFNSETVIRFALPEAGEVELAIFNLAGQQVAMLVNEVCPAGTYTVRWDGRDDDGRELASGVYLYRLRRGDGRQMETRKLVLVR